MSTVEQDTAIAALSNPVEHDGRPLYTLYPARTGDTLYPARTGDDAVPRVEPVASTSGRISPPREMVLSRFALLHREGGQFVIESPRAWCDVVIHDPAVLTVIGAFASPIRIDALPQVFSSLVLQRLVDDLVGACLLVSADDCNEETDLRLRQWSPFELWLHTRSRLGIRGGFNASWGLTGWGEGLFPPLPARAEQFPGAAIDLFRPDLNALRDNDPSLTAVIEDRCSIREHDNERPITLAQLGEFLYRCARVRGTHLLDGIEHVDRPFPSGGALHELEIYPLVRFVDDLEPGMYHYDGHAHQLRPVSGEGHATRQMIKAAELATGAVNPQVVLVIAARFGRMLWKYEGMGYAAVLKDVGVLYQVMYSVGTAMGLAACGIGGGPAEAFNEATGRDYFIEGAVGEFLLGSRPRQG